VSEIPFCPECHYTSTYEDRGLYICSECGHEWFAAQKSGPDSRPDGVVRDVNGIELKD